MRSESFSRLLKSAISSIANHEGKAIPAVEEELGQQVGVTGASIQRYKGGYLPPDMRTIEIIAEQAVRRGYLNRAWLEHFLQAAQYPNPQKLVERFYPATAATKQKLAPVYHNLPTPTYSQFVMRSHAYTEIIDALSQRTAVVLIASFGGMGKTSLARQIAEDCLRENSSTPRFEAVVWVSDKERPGTTNFSTVLDEIARTLDYPGLLQSDQHEKQRQVEQLLRRQRVLVVIDNFETITDNALVTWLVRMPEPSKALVTSRLYAKQFWSSWPVFLSGMVDQEAQEFISQCIREMRMTELVRDPAELTPLVTVTGGNPKAIKLALGRIRHGRQRLSQVIDDLYAARGEVFDDLLAWSWPLLNHSARTVLLAMGLFSNSISAEALAATADVQGYEFDAAVEQLGQLALLDELRANINDAPRYTLHSLVHAFVSMKLKEHPEFERAARERWVMWYLKVVAQVGYARANLPQLDILDAEKEMVYEVIEWCSQQQRHADTIRLVEGIGYFYHVRGIWDKKLAVHLLAAEAARHEHDYNAEVLSFAYPIQILSRQGNPNAAKKYVPRLQELANTHQLSEEALFEYQNALSFYWQALGDIDAVQHIWKHSPRFEDPVSDRIIDSWLAECLYEKKDFEGAKVLFHESLQDAERQKTQRGVVKVQTFLASIHLQEGDLDAAEQALEHIKPMAYLYKDRRHIALIQYLYAQIYLRRGATQLVADALQEAIDLFERLGMQRELAQATALQAEVNTLLEYRVDSISL